MEKLVDFNTALLAKEKGFDFATEEFFDLSNIFTNSKQSISEKYKKDWNNTTKYPEFKEKCYVSRPTQSLLKKWLRDKFCLHIEVIKNRYDDGWLPILIEFSSGNKNIPISLIPHSDYEKALEFGEIEALKILKLSKK